MHTGRLQAFNFQKWIKENEHLLKPPVGNKKVFEDGAMTVQVVGGPNERADYHDDPVEEFFYQLKGDMVLKVVDNGNFYDVPIREGDVFLLPAHIPHSPQRPAHSVGLVVERVRGPQEPEGYAWYCERCDTKLYALSRGDEDLLLELRKVSQAFNASASLRTCTACGYVQPVPTGPRL